MKRIATILLAAITLAVPAFARHHDADPRLANVHRIFVAGTNAPAEGVRDRLMKPNACFTLVGKAADADAVLEVTGDGNSSQGGAFGQLGGRNWIASATLTLASGDLVWSKSTSMTDRPFQANSGGKVAGDVLAKMLASDANCKL